jgi:hypothetical protein
VSVTARPSLRFRWSLDATPLEFLDGIPAATTVTPESGDFVLWVDPYVASTWAHYDVSFEPPSGADVPSWTLPDIEIPRDQNVSSIPLDTLVSPDAAFVHGRITDSLGSPVEGAELRIYQVVTDSTLCNQVTNAPDQCVIPAQLQGHGTSDMDGIVRLTLPRP